MHQGARTGTAFKEQPDAHEGFLNLFFLAKLRALTVHEIKTRFFESRRTQVATMGEHQTRMVYRGQTARHLPPGLRNLCLAYVAAQLIACGLTPVLWGPRLEGIDLDEDLCELLWAEMNLGSGALADKATADAELTTLFERWSNRNASAITLHLARWHRIALKALHT